MIVHEILEQTQISRDTFRFYEREGLLEGCPVARSSNGYRHYEPAVVNRIRMIRLAKDLGFSLKEIADLVVRWEQGGFTADEKIALFQNKIFAIRAKRRELAEMEHYLVEKIAMLRESHVGNLTHSHQ